MRIGEYVYQYRHEHGMTIQEFAKKSGLSKSYISIIERGVHPQNGKEAVPTLSTLTKLSTAMDITVAELLRQTDPVLRMYYGQEPVYESAAGEGRIGDGSPSETYAIKMGEDDVLVKVKGKSMEPTIMDGDLVVVSAQSVLDYPRQICLVKINGDESTIKRVEKKSNGLLLIGDNIDEYEPHFYTDDEVVNLPVTIEGAVIKIIREVE